MLDSAGADIVEKSKLLDLWFRLQVFLVNSIILCRNGGNQMSENNHAHGYYCKIYGKCKTNEKFFGKFMRGRYPKIQREDLKFEKFLRFI